MQYPQGHLEWIPIINTIYTCTCICIYIYTSSYLARYFRYLRYARYLPSFLLLTSILFFVSAEFTGRVGR